jgi:hypothetical protein
MGADVAKLKWPQFMTRNETAAVFIKSWSGTLVVDYRFVSCLMPVKKRYSWSHREHMKYICT